MQLRYEKPYLRKLNAGLLNKFGTRSEYAPLTHIEGAEVGQLVREHGSPLFVFSETKIRKNYQAAVRAFRSRYAKVQFAWSYKTNYLDAICRIFHQEGSWAEVVSGFEYQKALHNGVPGDRIIFNGPDKREEELALAVEQGSLIHLDHLDELLLLSEVTARTSKKARVGIRVNMDVGLRPLWDRFGFNLENGQAWSAIERVLSDPRLELWGLHTHIGTYMLSPQAYGIAATRLLELLERIHREHGRRLRYLDLGGGFPSVNTLKGAYLPGSDGVPSIDAFAEAICGVLNGAGLAPDDQPTLFLESGRALVDDAGYLINSVVANKRLADGRRATILDGGVNLLFTSFWYDHKVAPAQHFPQHTEDTALYGPLCMNIDVLRAAVPLPLMERGQQVVFQNVGAYNVTQWMQFISLRPNVVLLDAQSRAHVIRKAETVQTLLQQESVPAHLLEFRL
jgi:diaminopimelate decarboxylase